MTDASKPLSAHDFTRKLCDAVSHGNLTPIDGILEPLIAARDADLIREAQAGAEEAFFLNATSYGRYRLFQSEDGMHINGGEVMPPDPTFAVIEKWRERIEAQARIEMVEKCRTAVAAKFNPMSENYRELWNLFNGWKKDMEAELERLKPAEGK